MKSLITNALGLNNLKRPKNDCTLTSEGKKILDEISALEKEWEGVVNINDEDLEVLRKLALDSFEISYRHKKKKGFIF